MAPVVDGEPKLPFSIATTLKCRGGRYSFPWIAPLYPWYVPYNAELSKEISSTIFLCLWYDSTRNWTPVSRTIGKHSTHFPLFAAFSDVNQLLISPHQVGWEVLEYANCTFADGQNPTPQMSVLRMILYCIWWQGSSSEILRNGETFLCHYSLFHSGPGLIVPVSVPCMEQIELFNHLWKIITSYLKP